MISLLAALALAAADPPSAAGDTTVPPAAAATPAKKARDPNERVCWTEMPVGSHLPKEFCATRAEREAMERDGREVLRRNDRSANGGGLGPH